MTTIKAVGVSGGCVTQEAHLHHSQLRALRITSVGVERVL